jgi:hypothetical protein
MVPDIEHRSCSGATGSRIVGVAPSVVNEQLVRFSQQTMLALRRHRGILK